MEKELLELFQEYRKELNIFVKLNVKGPRMEKLKKNIQSSYATFLQERLPEFKRLKRVYNHHYFTIRLNAHHSMQIIRIWRIYKLPLSIICT
jgi:hypothetical protein